MTPNPGKSDEDPTGVADSAIADFDVDVKRPLGLLRDCPAYKATQCHDVTIDDVGRLFVKDESTRMGLGSFKALGGVYAVAALVRDRWHDRTGCLLRNDQFRDPAVRELAGSMTFVCASAGNHGLAVAVGARHFGAHARIHLAQSVPHSFAHRLSEKGAEVVRSGASYEDSVDAATQDAKNASAILLADGSWPGYWREPTLVMEGYTVLADELREFFTKIGTWPTHVFVQAGVGGLAAALSYMIRRDWLTQPEIIIVEPDAAPCLLGSAREGRAVTVTGPISNMGRLDCKAPSLIATRVLKEAKVHYQLVSDEDADNACATLRLHGLPSTPSGAAGFAGLQEYRASLVAGQEILPLVILTEGPVG